MSARACGSTLIAGPAALQAVDDHAVGRLEDLDLLGDVFAVGAGFRLSVRNRMTSRRPS